MLLEFAHTQKILAGICWHFFNHLISVFRTCNRGCEFLLVHSFSELLSSFVFSFRNLKDRAIADRSIFRTGIDKMSQGFLNAKEVLNLLLNIPVFSRASFLISEQVVSSSNRSSNNSLISLRVKPSYWARLTNRI